MTKKHYEAIAKAFREARPAPNTTTAYKNGYQQAVAEMAVRVGEVLREDNPKHFDWPRFIAACVPGTAVKT